MSDTFYIKIRYRGRLKSPSDVHQLIDETADICKTNGWSHKIWEEDWSAPQTLTRNFEDGAINFEGHVPLKGISLNIGDSEMVWLTFLPDGVLQSLFTITDPTFFLGDAEFPWQRVKTGFDGAKTHLALCKLFKYLAGKYFDVFEVLDESDYWIHGDDAKFTAWINETIHDYKIWNEELSRIMEDDTLSIDEKRARTQRITKEYGDKYRAKNNKGLLK